VFSLVASQETPEEIYQWLMLDSRGTPVTDLLARMLASWSLGFGALPAYLGLSAFEFRRMLQHHFPAVGPDGLTGSEEWLDPQRWEEMADLRKLLLRNRSGDAADETWLTEIVIAGCMGSDHLWQDLGLWNRADLSRLMHENFGPLASHNVKDMKWKKFLYKQLCAAEGIYTCRAPSCEVCADYQNCFGPEE
jgi:nitrogen fixation protein NifQ